MTPMQDTQSRIEPHRITKPIQLLAAWLAGLVAINGTFLGTALVLTDPWWLKLILVVAAVVNVPLFLALIFLLQTRFRPEMQEDTYFAKYLESRITNKPGAVTEELSALKVELFGARKRTLESVENLQSQISTIEQALSAGQNIAAGSNNLSQLNRQIDESRRLIRQARVDINWTKYTIAVNDLLPAYEGIAKVLESNGVTISYAFGSSSQVPFRPGLFLLVFGTGVEAKDVQELIRLLIPFGLEAITFASENMHQQRIYIGGYGYHVPPSARLTSQFLDNILRPELTTEGFIQTVTMSSKAVLGDLTLALDSLKSDERLAARSYLGLGDGQEGSVEDVSRALRVSRERAISTVTDALVKLDQLIVH